MSEPLDKIKCIERSIEVVYDDDGHARVDLPRVAALFVIPRGSVWMPEPWVRAKIESGEWTVEREEIDTSAIPPEGYVPPDWRAIAADLGDALAKIGAIEDPEVAAAVVAAMDQFEMARMSEAEFGPPKEEEPPPSDEEDPDWGGV